MWLAQENGKLQLKNIASRMFPEYCFTPEACPVPGNFFSLFFCVCSLLNKPTVPENGTHHTAAVEKSAAKKTPPSVPPPWVL